MSWWSPRTSLEFLWLVKRNRLKWTKRWLVLPCRSVADKRAWTPDLEKTWGRDGASPTQHLEGGCFKARFLVRRGLCLARGVPRWRVLTFISLQWDFSAIQLPTFYSTQNGRKILLGHFWFPKTLVTWPSSVLLPLCSCRSSSGHMPCNRILWNYLHPHGMNTRTLGRWVSLKTLLLMHFFSIF